MLRSTDLGYRSINKGARQEEPRRVGVLPHDAMVRFLQSLVEVCLVWIESILQLELG